MKITIENAASTKAWVKSMNANGAAVHASMVAASEATAKEIEEQGRADIAAAGRFGPAWTDSLKSTVKDEGDAVSVVTTMEGARWRMFQEGGTQQGRPLLWIPLSHTDAVGIRSSKYPGELTRVDRPGKAPLLVAEDEPKYFGATSVTIPKKFHLIEITQHVGADIGARYTDAFKGLKDG